MGSVQRTAQSEEDLIEIWLYIAQDNPHAADRVLDDLEQRFIMLADNPQMGRYRPDIAPELRYFISGKYLILYRTLTDGVQIVRVIHGARDLPNVI
ncbi:type II toxin-antitoxin system RelE/ParE family toxin [Methylomonas sp. LW13]|uniref:type II toxin-antitoxin system RelE/ParE family toxin n=1 Tax=unclassified Methylomonas TaxID=2608980 RepID=UPI00051B1945|nr:MULTISPECIES: type II toxin-antitoxin system RelE/ParE family toxin [unclassified Methylomonas]PKD37963.1 type II toxin-antitoxin system RelE/ParE family toxin [Methylomonas sp. Kb3]QBC28285.1 type II toxin-antitoxin system RelE/ParE family toxin [Methylomonas sp. LW13]